MAMTQGKADAAAASAVAAAGTAWTDVLHSFLEWGVLIFGFITGAFALYWNVRKLYREHHGKNNRRLDDYE